MSFFFEKKKERRRRKKKTHLPSFSPPFSSRPLSPSPAPPPLPSPPLTTTSTNHTAAPAPDGAAKYVRLLQQLAADGDAVLNVDAADVAAFDATLYSQLLKYPSEVITLLDDEARHVVAGLTGADPADVNVSSKPFNLAEVKVIRDLNPADVNQLVSVRGMLTRASPVIPDLRVACFRCDACGAEEHAYNDRGRIEEPAGCAACGARWTARLLHNRSGFFDKQVVKVQESPDAIPEGETPHSATLLAFDDAVDAARPGDRVVVTGIYKVREREGF